MRRSSSVARPTPRWVPSLRPCVTIINQSEADWVSCRSKDNRDGGCRPLCRNDGRGFARDDDTNFHLDELSQKCSEEFGPSLSLAIVDFDIAALNPAKFAQPLHKGSGPLTLVDCVSGPKNPMVGWLPGP